MDSKIILFEESPMLGGYSLAVRDDWVYKIKRVHVSEKEKSLYEKQFGDKILTYSEFYDWWCNINHLGRYSTDKS
jgi:hypothetical protein